MVDIYLLEQLIAFEKYGTLSAVAEHLNITQPSLSRSMKKLESQVGVSLFERNKNKIKLNETGKLATDYAKRILEDEQMMLNSLLTFERSKHTISIGSIAPGALFAFTPMLSRLYPKMTISSDLKNETELLEGLNNNIYQIIFLSHSLENGDYSSFKCLEEQLYITVPQGHKFVHKKSISFKELNGESFLMYQDVGIWDKIVRENMPDSHFLIQNEMNVLEELVGASTIASFVTNVTSQINIRQNNARTIIPISDTDATVSFYAIVKKESEKNYQDFLTSIRIRET